MENRQIPRMISIIDGLWLGNRAAASDPDIMRAHDVTRIFSVLGTEWTEPVAECAHSLNIEHKVFPIEDSVPFDAHCLIMCEILPWIREGIRSGGSALIHCHAGISRSSSGIITYLVWNGMSVEEALTLLKRQHPIASPHPDVLRSFLRCIGKDLPADYRQWIEAQWKVLKETTGIDID